MKISDNIAEGVLNLHIWKQVVFPFLYHFRVIWHWIMIIVTLKSGL